MEMNRCTHYKTLFKTTPKNNDKKWLRTTEHLLCVSDVKEEWTPWLLALFEFCEDKIMT